MKAIESNCRSCMAIDTSNCPQRICVDCMVHNVQNPGCSHVEPCRRKVASDLDLCRSYKLRQWDN